MSVAVSANEVPARAMFAWAGLLCGLFLTLSVSITTIPAYLTGILRCVDSLALPRFS
jgi:hypothetical protein